MKRFLSFALVVSAACTGMASAQEFTFVYPEVSGNTNTGFDDPTVVVSDITGLSTTLGADRRACIEAAADVWAQYLDITVSVQVEATFSSQGGSNFGAPLGFAGPITVFRDFVGAPQASTWFPVAQANQLRGADLDPSNVDIQADFNADVDLPTVLGSVSWYYGTDGNPGADIDFYSVAMHELGHGLGFLTLVGGSGALSGGFADIYARQLQDTSITPSNFVSMSNSQRAAAIIGGNLTWKGTEVVAAKGGPVAMYAPDPIESGSSTSHWDTSVTPNEVMEPFATDPFTDLGLEVQAFEDMLWPLDAVAEGEGTTEGSTEGEPDPTTVSIDVTGGSSIEQGGSFSLSAVVEGGTASSYQWVRGGNDLSGETAATLTRASASVSDTGSYRVRIETGAKAIVVSEPVQITVVPVGGLPVGGGLGLAAVAFACAMAGGIRLRKRN